MELPYKEILTWASGLSSAYLMFRVQAQRDKIKSIENQLSDKKYKMYSELIYIFLDLSRDSKLGKEATEQELVEKIYNIKRDMFIYAPDDVFRKFTEWVLNVGNANNPTKHFIIYYDLITLIRKEMGNRKTNLTLDDFMLFYMQNQDEYDKFKKMNGWK